MRSMQGYSGTCDQCGKFAYLWVDRAVDLSELGVKDKLLGRQLCDTCEHERAVRDAFASDPAMAERCYCIDRSEVERYLAIERRKHEQYEREEARRCQNP